MEILITFLTFIICFTIFVYKLKKDKFKVEFITPIYCINLKSSEERRGRMKFKFDRVLNAKNVTFINALKPEDLSNIFHIGHGKCWYDWLKTPEDNDTIWKKDLCCYYSHVKAIKTFYYQNMGNFNRDEWGLICEDDILFRNDFTSEFNEMKLKIPEDINLVTLGFMMDGSRLDPDKVNSFKGTGFATFIESIWGTQAYIIRYKYALELLNHYEKRIDKIPINTDGKVTSEVIIRRSNGLICIPPLVIEDCIDSDRNPLDVPYHVKHFGYWEWKNYNNSDPNKLSPLCNIKKEACWNHYSKMFG